MGSGDLGPIVHEDWNGRTDGNEAEPPATGNRCHLLKERLQAAEEGFSSLEGRKRGQERAGVQRHRHGRNPAARDIGIHDAAFERSNGHLV